MKKNKYLFIDRDGTIIKEPPVDFQVDSLDKLEFVSNAISAIRNIVNETDYILVMVSNQDGLGTDSFPMEDFRPPHEMMLKILKGEGIQFKEILIDESFPEDNSPNRKPEIGMVKHYMNELMDTDNSYVIGDRLTDIILAKNMGIQGIYLAEEQPKDDLPFALTTVDWNEIYSFIKNGSRKAKVERETKETKISVELDLNGRGRGDIGTGLNFFDHMLDQIARHGGVDLTIKTKGDLHIDEHHTIEDTAIALGEAFRMALGGKKGIERYGFSLPMDESEAKVLLDFGGRASLVWDVDLCREYAGDFPTDMTKHFFEAFSQSCGCNLNIVGKGENTHHIIEAVFKAFARTVKQAIQQNGYELPSSKGML